MSEAFLVLTPLGLPRAGDLAAALDSRRIAVVAREVISPWARASTSLYARGSSEAAKRRAAVFEARWLELFPEDRAERWWLGGHEDYARLIGQKAILRAGFPGAALGAALAGCQPFRLHAFHVPDPLDLEVEATRLDRYRVAVG